MKRDLDADVNLKLPEIKQREHAFEYKVRDALKEHDVLFVKIKPTIEGFPDRLAIGNARTKLVELKREGESLSEMQELIHADLKDMGIEVLVVEGPDVKAAVKAITKALRL